MRLDVLDVDRGGFLDDEGVVEFEARYRLGVERGAVKPATRKQLPDSLKAYVANYDEMLEMIRAAGYPELAEGL